MVAGSGWPFPDLDVFGFFCEVCRGGELYVDLLLLPTWLYVVLYQRRDVHVIPEIQPE